MALNLSESRRRHLSAGYLAAPPVPSTRRVTSAGLPLGTASPQLHGGYQNYGAGGSLRAHLQQQRRISRNLSPLTGRSSPRSRHASRSAALSTEQSDLLLPIPNYGYKFSAATLARAEKARTAIELSVEYRRLLNLLPPLKPDSTAPGNYRTSASSVPGSGAVHLYQIPSFTGDRYKLGRSYNPLQYLRNRRLRARVGRPLDPGKEEFNDTERVRAWIDTVQRISGHEGYREQDGVNLPAYSDQLSAAGVQPESEIGHRRAGTASSNIKRPRMDWHFSPSGLLADVVWLEQGDNKGLIETRHSYKIFPNLEPRQSKESAPEPEAKRHSTVGSVVSTIRSGLGTADNSDEENHRGRKRRHLLPVLGDKSIRRAWRASRTRSGSASGLSSSDGDDSSRRRGRKLRQALTTDDENTGPLEKYLNDIPINDPKDDDMSSPSVLSPDTPNKWGHGHVALSGDRVNLDKRDSRDFAASDGSHQAVSGISHLGKPTLNGRPKEPRVSFDGFDSTAPNSPSIDKSAAQITPDPTPPSSRKPSPTRKSHKSKLSIFRSDTGKKDKDTSAVDAATTDHKDHDSSPAPSADAENQNRRSIDRPHVEESLKNPPTHRRDESRSSLRRVETRTAKDGRTRKEPGSAVSRFFKGGRLGEIVRSESAKVGGFIWRKETLGDDQRSVKSFSDVSEFSETEDEGPDAGRMKQRPKTHKRTVTIGDTLETDPKYHRVNLPSFKPFSATQEEEEAAQANTANGTDDPVHRQQLELKKRNRSARFDRLAPPKINISTASTPNLSRQNTDDRRGSYASSTQSRKQPTDRLTVSYTKAGRDSPPSSLKLDRQRSPSRPPINSKRHWSISDPSQHQRRQSSTTIEPSATLATDLARTRALLLSTGIKAHTIHLLASSPRSPPSPFLLKAAAAAPATLGPVPRNEEHILAAKLLSSAIEAEIQGLQSSAADFRAQTAALHSSLSDLRQSCEDELTPRVRGCADEADEVTRRLTQEMPLAVKEVSDRIDLMLRTRRRRTRWVRRVGWKVLELAVLGAMWGVWAVVVLVRFVAAVVRAPVRAVRWALWL
ncbi:hypothetical protein W97_01834 [Coniosporium apollinis CBS 100218]|uniref:Uncharacterized protein n=1 Tax=Coniosporium apollinis (strain CBS 100218) TaxID=1168221 RepID=R7YL47_CONA1|nr:uncharacterized protein W97_01834 [Coniosporium apollinis CBS 100218]EON62610.1 hypothetical protein W97_01834 [Coniosporium apollinis CBS 100218]